MASRPSLARAISHFILLPALNPMLQMTGRGDGYSGRDETGKELYDGVDEYLPALMARQAFAKTGADVVFASKDSCNKYGT